MTGKVSVVGFLVRHRDDVRVAEVIPVVDGRDLTDLAHDFEKTAGMETRDVYTGANVASGAAGRSSPRSP